MAPLVLRPCTAIEEKRSKNGSFVSVFPSEPTHKPAQKVSPAPRYLLLTLRQILM